VPRWKGDYDPAHPPGVGDPEFLVGESADEDTTDEGWRCRGQRDGWPLCSVRTWNHLECLTTSRSIDDEIVVEREDALVTIAFGKRNQTRVSKIHRAIGIFVHQFTGSRHQPRRDVHDLQVSQLDLPPQDQLSGPTSEAAEQMHRLGERRRRCHHGQRNGIQNRDARPMVVVISIDEGDQRTGIGQYHGRCLSATRSANTLPDSRALLPDPEPTAPIMLPRRWRLSVPRTLAARSADAARMNSDCVSPAIAAACSTSSSSSGEKRTLVMN